ncbi:hypothetical protein [Paenibacillus sp. HJGM_3]|uniref:hypothetical protein n=1 Tax=Paenibacillus sp. HJGM_3 TaxID=3379816 RepID=UPI00386E8A89
MRMETEDDIQLIKRYTLMPILLDMLARDAEELAAYRDKIVYNHLLYYLKEVETALFRHLQTAKQELRQRDIRILSTEANVKGIHVEYQIRGYVHQFNMLRSLIKAELMTLLMHTGGKGGL